MRLGMSFLLGRALEGNRAAPFQGPLDSSTDRKGSSLAMGIYERKIKWSE